MCRVQSVHGFAFEQYNHGLPFGWSSNRFQQDKVAINQIEFFAWLMSELQIPLRSRINSYHIPLWFSGWNSLEHRLFSFPGIIGICLLLATQLVP